MIKGGGVLFWTFAYVFGGGGDWSTKLQYKHCWRSNPAMARSILQPRSDTTHMLKFKLHSHRCGQRWSLRRTERKSLQHTV